MNRRELIQSLVAVHVARLLPGTSETCHFVSFNPAPGHIRGSIAYNRDGGRVIYSIATDRRPKP